MFDLTGKIALVTGASRGLGWAMAQSLARCGAHVVLNARDPAALEERVAALRADGLSGERDTGNWTSWWQMPASTIARRSVTLLWPIFNGS